MENYRLFIDLPVDPPLVRDLIKRFKRLDLDWKKIKTARPEQVHITLKFLGDTPLDSLDKIIAVLQNIKIENKMINLELEQAKIFNPASPRVLALGLKTDKNIQELYEKIEDSLWQADLAHQETRRFTPHLTLARVKQSSQPKEFQNFLNWRLPALSISPTYFELQSSQLTSTGPQYTVLQTFEL